MSTKRKVLRGGQKVLGSLASGAGDEILTRDITTKEVGVVPAIDASVYLSTSLLDGKIFIGNSSNLAQARTLTGSVLITNLGVSSIASDVITNNNIFSGAGILYSKLNLNNSIVNNDIATNANITRTKIASGNAYKILINNSTGAFTEQIAITPNRVLISDSNGLPIDSSLTTTVLTYIDPTSSIQNQLNNRLIFSSTIIPLEGDLIVYQSGIWNRFAKGSSGQYLTSTVGGLTWATTPNGVPSGGAANQILRKIDTTDYNTQWHTLLISDLTDITASATQVNVLSNGFYDATSSIQTQFGSKLNNALANNALFVGNPSNQASQLSPGTNGQVLTVVAGVPQWQTVTGTGTVTSVALSGGSTGLTVTGSPITTSGTITLTGTLGTANGGTNITSFTTGDMLYASSSSVLSKLAIATNGYILTLSGGLPTWQINAGAVVLTTKGDIFTYDTGNQRLAVGINGYVLTADSGEATGLKWALPVSEPFPDNMPIIKNNADNTKLVKFDASNLTTATTRTYSLSDFNGTIALLGATNGAALSKIDDTNITLTLSAGSGTALLNATTLTLGWTGTLADDRITSSSSWNTAYDRSGTSLGFTSSTFTFTKQDTSTLTVAVPTFNQNTTGSAATLTTGRTISITGDLTYTSPTFNGSSNITAAGTLANTAVTPNPYTINGNAIFTVDSKGRLTSASNVTISIASLSPLTTKGDIFVYSTINDRLPIASGDGKILQVSSGAATGLAYSTPTYPSASGTSGKFLISDGTNNIYSTSTIPTSAGATSLKHLRSDGTNYILTTATISDSPSTSGKVLISDGTNWITSTSIFPNTIGSTGTILRSDGTINTYTTATYPNTVTVNRLLYVSAANVISDLATANSSLLVTDGSGIPSLSTTIPNGVIATTQSASDNSTKLATTAYTDNQATLGNWRLASGGTLTGVNTITSNTAIQMIFNGTWTATANTQNHADWTGTITARNTVSDTLRYLVIDPTLVSAAATQTLTAVLINPTFTDSNSATKYILRIQNAASDRFTIGFDGATTITSGNSSTNSTLSLIGIGSTTNYTLRTFQSGGSIETFSIKDNGLLTSTSTVSSNLLTATWIASANNQISKQLTDNVTLRATASDIATALYFNPSLTLGSTTQNPIGLNLDVNFIQTGGISTLYVPATQTLTGMTATTYNNVAPASTSGSGTGALFTVIVSSAINISSITQTTAGSGYKVNETVTFNGSQFGSGSSSIVCDVHTVTGVSLGTSATALKINVSGNHFLDNPRGADFYYQGSKVGAIGIGQTSAANSPVFGLFDESNVLALYILSNSIIIKSPVTLTGATTFSGTTAFSSSMTNTFANTTNAGVFTMSGNVGAITATSSFQSKFKTSYSLSGTGVGLSRTLSLTSGGTGYTTGTKATTGGTGTGLTISVTTVSGGVVTVINTTPIARGSGYTINDVVTLATGGANATVTITAVDFAGTIVAFESANTITDANSNNLYATLLDRTTYNITSTQVGSTWFGYYNPTYTAIGSFTKGGIAIVPTGTVNGIGTGSPTGTLHLVGSGSIPTFKTVGVGTTTNYSIRSFQSDGTTAILNLQDNGNFSIPIAASLSGFGTSSQTSTLESGGSFGAKTASVSADTTLDVTYFTVRVDASGANRTITLPTASGDTGRIYVILKSDSSANTVTISTTAGGNKVINTQYSGYMVQSNGTSYNVISSF